MVQGGCGAGHGVQASVVQCIGAAWCWAGVVQGGSGAGERSAERRWCRQVWCSVVQSESGVENVVQKCV